MKLEKELLITECRSRWAYPDNLDWHRDSRIFEITAQQYDSNFAEEQRKRYLGVMNLSKKKAADMVPNSRLIRLDYESALMFNVETLKKYGIKPSSCKVGKILAVTLESRKLTKKELSKRPKAEIDDLSMELEERTKIGWDYYFVQAKRNSHVYVASFTNEKDPIDRGRFSFKMKEDYHLDQPSPVYNLEFLLTKKEYNQLKRLSGKTVMKFSCRLK